MTYSAELRTLVDDVLGPHFAQKTDDAALWAQLTALDWPAVGVPEQAGGAGGELRDAAEIAAGIGRHAVALPVVEIALAGWVLARAGVSSARVSGRCVAVVPVHSPSFREAGPDWVLDGSAGTHRWAAGSTTVLVARQVERTLVAVVAPSPVDPVVPVDPAERNLADEPLGLIEFDGLRLATKDVAVCDAALADEVEARMAIVQAAMMGGAIERIATLTLRHLTTREQFGKTLISHQAVQHLVADIAVRRDLVLATVEAAIDNPTWETAAAARITASRAAGIVAAHAHQLHGAIGITREYPLHLLTRRLWAWRDAGGSQRQWQERLGHRLLTGGADNALWSLVAASTP
jgi:alkylation response protein AidB-like acyl-CoA dehydrogenase